MACCARSACAKSGAGFFQIVHCRGVAHGVVRPFIWYALQGGQVVAGCARSACAWSGAGVPGMKVPVYSQCLLASSTLHISQQLSQIALSQNSSDKGLWVRSATAAEAYQGEGGRWEVPDKPAARLRPSSGVRPSQHAGLCCSISYYNKMRLLHGFCGAEGMHKEHVMMHGMCR